MKGAIYVQSSSNHKLSGSHGKIDATYTSISRTCSPTCPLKADRSCYALNSYVGLINKRLNSRARQYSPLQLARAEAKAIDAAYRGGKIPSGRDLRLHVSGDSRTIRGTRILAKAAARWKKRSDNPGAVFTYTHSWAHVPRQEWGTVSVLASIETTQQVAAARQQGYAPALIVPEHTTDKAHTIAGCDTKWIPCPAQTHPKEVSCQSCKLCMKSDWLYETNRGIAFAAHGSRKNLAKKHLTILQ